MLINGIHVKKHSYGWLIVYSKDIIVEDDVITRCQLSYLIKTDADIHYMKLVDLMDRKRQSDENKQIDEELLLRQQEEHPVNTYDTSVDTEVTCVSFTTI